MATVIEIEDMITVGALADKLSLPVTKIITVLMKNGVLATVNEKIDFDTAQIISGELGLEDVELVKKASAAEARAEIITLMRRTRLSCANRPDASLASNVVN